MSVFAGVQGFKGPLDQGSNGNFGFHEGINLSGQLESDESIAYQLGWQAIQSDLTGTIATPDDHRGQHFVTAAIFHRSRCGMQYGIAWDWIHDEFIQDVNINQIRAELGLLNQHGKEIGFWTALNTRDDTNALGSLITSTDQYAFFYRMRFPVGGDGRLWGGFTGQDDGLFGGDIRMPLSDNVSFLAGANYVIPHDSGGSAGAQDEAWNLGIHFVWHTHGGALCNSCDSVRPMFDVADNGSFILR